MISPASNRSPKTCIGFSQPLAAMAARCSSRTTRAPLPPKQRPTRSAPLVSGPSLLLSHRQAAFRRRGNSRALVASAVTEPPPGSVRKPSDDIALRVRQAKVDDAEAVARLCAEVFSTAGSPETDDAQLKKLLSSLETSYSSRITTKLTSTISASMQRKQQAASQARLYRTERRAAQLRRELAALRGEPLPPLPPVSIEADRWLRGVRSTRMFMSLVAVESSGADSGSSSSSVPAATRIASRDILGCVTLTVRRAEAQLPPPFPSKALPRLYVCNMAVSASFRRRGIARAMLLEAERIGQLWGERSLWLHVEHDNDEALALYTSSGFQFHSTDPWWYFGKRKLLLWKELPQVCMKASRSVVSAGPAENISGSIESNGVFKWTLEAGSGDLADAVTDDGDSDNNDSNGSSSSSYDG